MKFRIALAIVYEHDSRLIISFNFRKMGHNLKRYYEQNKYIPTIYKEHRCQKCHDKLASYIRKLDLKKIPQKYILDIDHPCARLIITTYKIKYHNKYYFINFPKEYLLTKYHYYLCSDCYKLEDDHACMPWNYWTKFN